MRVGVLEWICGGGLQDAEVGGVSASLQAEGMAMLSAVAEDLARGDHEVLLSLDKRVFTQDERREAAAKYRVFNNVSAKDGLPTSWWEVAHNADVVLIIAPEFSQVLKTAITKLAAVSKRLLNCCGEFLEVSRDKWLAAQRWQAAGVLHPATRLLCDVDMTWIAANQAPGELWIIKPRDGAGCEGIQVVGSKELLDASVNANLHESTLRYIAQPFHRGEAYSRSAIVDATGRTHWLPLVTQQLSVSDSIRYLGGRVLMDEQASDWFDCALRSLGVGALGWVSLDVLRCSDTGEWMVIEANPRLTTSFVGLNHAFGGGLTELLLNAVEGRPVEIARDWVSVAFDARGCCG